MKISPLSCMLEKLSYLIMVGRGLKKNNSEFDVTMGSLDGAKICEMVGLYILHKISHIIPHDYVGLYRDDGLAMVTGSGPQMDRLRKDIHKLFQGMKLDVTVETNLLITDYLDVTFNLNDGSFSPYTKPGNQIKYVSSSLNHPPHIKNRFQKWCKIDSLRYQAMNIFLKERLQFTEKPYRRQDITITLNTMNQ